MAGCSVYCNGILTIMSHDSLLAAALLILLAISVCAAPEHSRSTAFDSHDCDVLVAGGSTAALATAITAAEADRTLTVCLTEPTDWPGGQMTSSGVSAIDFGVLNRHQANQPKSFSELVAFLLGQGAGSGDVQPPGCWVSSVCYSPERMATGFVPARLAALPNLVLFARTVVRAAVRSSDGSALKSLELVQRTPRKLGGVGEWGRLLSATLPDWFSPQDSALFTKRVFNVSASVFVDATEFGDVLMTAGLVSDCMPNYLWRHASANGAQAQVSSPSCFTCACCLASMPRNCCC